MLSPNTPNKASMDRITLSDTPTNFVLIASLFHPVRLSAVFKRFYNNTILFNIQHLSLFFGDCVFHLPIKRVLLLMFASREKKALDNLVFICWLCYISGT